MAYLPLRLDYLTPEMQERAKTELRETEETQKKAVIELRNLIKGEADLVCGDYDKYLIQYLRSRKYNVNRTFNLLLNYYHTKKKHPEVYKHDFLGLKSTFANKSIGIMPYRDKDGAIIIVYRLDCWNYKERKFGSIIHDMTVSALGMVDDPATQVCGIKLIIDLRSLSLNHVKNIPPKYILLMVNGIKNCLPIRLKEAHIINESPLIQYFWNIIKYALNNKMRERLHFHSSNMKDLHEHVSPDVLPVELGGKIHYDPTEFIKHVDSLEYLYDELMSYGYRDS